MKKDPNRVLISSYLPIKAFTPKYNNAIAKTMTAIPPTMSKKLATPAVISADVGILIKANPANIQAT